jgi:hypothetical protein
MAQWPTKDPDAILDYQVDWSKWLGADTIETSIWLVPAGLTKTSAGNTPTTATIWLGGGVDGESYTLTNRITTAEGRTDDRSVTLLVAEK